MIKFKKSSKNHANASFKGLTEIIKRLSPENDNNDDEQKNDDNNIDDIDIYDDMVVDCICGTKMQCIQAKKAYNKCKTVYCDVCAGQFFNEMVFHCPMGNDIRFHKSGFDLCVKCANKKVEAEKKEQQESDEDNVVPKSQEPKKEQKQEQEQEQKHEPAQPAPVPSVTDEPEAVEPESEPPKEEFVYQAQLTTIKEVLALDTDERDEIIKTLLVQNKGDVSKVVPLLLQ